MVLFQFLKQPTVAQVIFKSFHLQSTIFCYFNERRYVGNIVLPFVFGLEQGDMKRIKGTFTLLPGGLRSLKSAQTA
jgi:hypothetical protein